MTSAKKTIGIVAGEQSGQLLAGELLEELTQQLGHAPELIGVGGGALQERGLKSIFDADEIALTGISSVVKALPMLYRRIGQTADAIIAAKPDCLLLIDSPEFSLRVARRVKDKLPDLPVIKYVAPTVWAWRPGRAAKMKAYVDHVLAILPFEPTIMEELGGPKTHYVGHRLMADDALEQVRTQNLKRRRAADSELNLLVLPGSRGSEIRSLLDEFGKAVEILNTRGHRLRTTIPTLPRHVDEVRRRTAGWTHAPKITTTREQQLEAYANAHAALAASGTVTLELALAAVPAVSCYKVDPLMKLATSLITTWSAALPNLIADRPVIREFFNEQIRPGMLARCVEELSDYGQPARKAVLNGYADVHERMKTEVPASQKAAAIIAEAIRVK